MNNEPVAYGMLTFCKNCGEQNPYSAKTLTDEEIIEVWDKMCSIVLDGDKNITAFARAILRKAQEK
jgi:type VI protein secretion system component Hcp